MQLFFRILFFRLCHGAYVTLLRWVIFKTLSSK